MNRRNFLQSTTTLSALAVAPAFVSGRNLNSKLQLAAVGTEGRGWADLSAMASHPKAQYVAFCDVDLSRTKRAKNQAHDASVFQDYREMLAKNG